VKTWLKTSVACASGLLLAACGGRADDAAPRDGAPAPVPVLSVKDAWARAADSGAMTAVYFTLENAGTVADTLTAVESAAAEETAMHMSMQQGGMMRMAPLRALPVPAEDSVRFVPMGAHVMLTRLTRPLADGDTVRVTLRFVSGQVQEVRAGVRRP